MRRTNIKMSKVQGGYVKEETAQYLFEEALGKVGVGDLDALYLVTEGTRVNAFLDGETQFLDRTITDLDIINDPDIELPENFDALVKAYRKEDIDWESQSGAPAFLTDLRYFREPAILVYEREALQGDLMEGYEFQGKRTEGLRAILQCDTSP